MKTKEILIVTVCIAIAILGLGICGYVQTHYTIEAKVIAKKGNEIRFEDSVNQIWIWETENKDEFSIGQTVKLYMDNNCTDGTRKDDIILKIKK